MTESSEPKRDAEIRFKVALDDQHMPVSIEWDATDSEQGEMQPTRSIMLSVWNHEENKAMRIDLWTPEMLVDEMKLFMFQNLMTMADTFERATSETERADEIRVFANDFAGKLGFVRDEGDEEEAHED